MPLCTLHLVSFSSSQYTSSPVAAVRSFLGALLLKLPSRDSLLLAGLPQRWIITPSRTSSSVTALHKTPWHLLLLVKGDIPLPTELLKDNEAWTVRVGVPSRIIDDFHTRNAALLTDAGPPLTGSLDSPKTAQTGQGLEATPELLEWARKYDAGRKERSREETRAVSMLNLLKFKEGLKERYQKYGKAFAESIGSKRGGIAKVVGLIVASSGSGVQDWEEIAIAHYPSSLHFADMAASQDYQAVNHEYRLPSLEDTCILCVREIDVDKEVLGAVAADPAGRNGGDDEGAGPGRSVSEALRLRKPTPRL